MKQPIIEIPRANENLVKALINAGILEVTENGIKVTENQKGPAAGKQTGPITNLHVDYTTKKESKQ